MGVAIKNFWFAKKFPQLYSTLVYKAFLPHIIRSIGTYIVFRNLVQVRANSSFDDVGVVNNYISFDCKLTIPVWVGREKYLERPLPLK